MASSPRSRSTPAPARRSSPAPRSPRPPPPIAFRPPLEAGVPCSATLAVSDRYWAGTASGEEEGVSQPLVSAFAGSPDALQRLDVASGPGTWARRLAALRPDLAIETGGAVLSTWDDDPWAAAAYSVAAPAETVATLTRPRGRIAFAAEHLGGEMGALMEGAIRSGRAAAASLLTAPGPS